MIYLITGVPGSGKTLYAVSTLVQKLASEYIEKDGVQVPRRVVVDGIPNLVIPHDLMAPGLEDGNGGLKPQETGDGLWNWMDWCRPGDVIVVDEVQRWWRPRGMGTKPPKEISALETHRHKGVDFVIITQNPMLIDQNVRRLVGRHQHIRRILGMARAIVYDWDGCSVDVHRIKTATTSYFGYPKSAYALYKSSELHTKQKQKIPLWIGLPIVALVAGVFVAPKAFSTLSGAATGKGVSSAPAPSASPPKLSELAIAVPPMPTASAPVPPLDLGPSPVQSIAISGCIVVADRCGCMDMRGEPVEVPAAVCSERSGAGRGKPIELQDTPTARVPDAAELDAVRFAFLNKTNGGPP